MRWECGAPGGSGLEAPVAASPAAGPTRQQHLAGGALPGQPAGPPAALERSSQAMGFQLLSEAAAVQRQAASLAAEHAARAAAWAAFEDERARAEAEAAQAAARRKRRVATAARADEGAGGEAGGAARVAAGTPA